MKANVNDACIGCGMCEGVCPEIFHMTDAGQAKAEPSDVTPELEGKVAEARDGCPVNAIETE